MNGSLRQLLIFFTVAFQLVACTSVRRAATKDDGRIDFVFVQVNDVYEIAPLAGGQEGGMARVATVKQQYQKTNPNTFLVMAGDFVSPSVYNSLQYEGKRIRGRQMIEAMNAAGMDIAVFGNHEFDISETELQDRINESGFQWVSSNTFHKQNGNVTPFVKTSGQPPFPKYLIKTISDNDGTTAKIGFIGLTLPFNKADYVSYTDPLTTARELYTQIKDSVDAVVAITHQAMEDDVKLAKELPGLALILGGHEHDMRKAKEGTVYITKAHANAKSAYVVKMRINKKKKSITAEPELLYLNASVPLDSATNTVVQKWTGIAEKNYSSMGFDAKKVVLSGGGPLDGRETEVRSRSTDLTKLIVAAIAYAVPEADVVLFNAGSIRVDDILQPPVTEYDIIRALPFGGGIREADMKGSLLIKVLDQGIKNRGIGGFLHYNEAVTYDAGTWKLKGLAIDPAKTYRVAMSEFLFTGKEANLEFLNPSNPDIVKVYDAETSVASNKSDVRLAMVHYLEKQK
ncbi:MAG: 5'-nucleotidase C-terminal domain-containing protein [Flavisolibacter sp.]|nr:5'-nucleotidase C-terminal domain-containing protein [Flavisolibacter sp.]